MFGFAVAGAPVAGAVVAAPGSGVVAGSVAGSVGVCVAGACVVEGATVTVAGLPVELLVSVPLPPPQEAQYTFCSLPGMARFTMAMMLASVGIPAMLTCSSLGPMQVCMMGFLRWVTALTLMSQH